MRIQTVPSDSVDILIVDDDASTRAGLRLLLERRGYRCAEANDGRQALALAREQSPRCVLLDLLLPGVDGFTVARRLRGDLRTFSMHIHCLTSLRDDRVREQALRAGCEQFLTKPVDPAELLAVVGRPSQQEAPLATVVSRLSKKRADELLDWVANHGCTGLAVTLEEDGFAVRCICPPGLHLIQDEDGKLRLWPRDAR
jgi:CheY-like chemotaxis protein